MYRGLSPPVFCLPPRHHFDDQEVICIEMSTFSIKHYGSSQFSKITFKYSLIPVNNWDITNAWGKLLMRKLGNNNSEYRAFKEYI